MRLVASANVVTPDADAVAVSPVHKQTFRPVRQADRRAVDPER